MSITAETAKEHANDPAVLCCRAEEGVTIEAANLEDPGIFDDLVDTGLLNLEGALTIEEVIGATLTKTCDSLTPLTKEVLKDIKPKAGSTESNEVENEEVVAEEVTPVVAGAVAYSQVVEGGVLKISIGEGKDIYLEIPIQ
jgi:D-proline reductase (dithiol) PrdA